MKNTFRPKLVIKPDSVELVDGSFSRWMNLVLWLIPLLFALAALYFGYFMITDESHRYIRLGVLTYGVGMVLYSIIKAPKRFAHSLNRGAALAFNKHGISRRTLTMENRQQYQWSDIDKLVVTPNLLLSSSNHNSQHTDTILVVFNNARYSQRINDERQRAREKPTKVNGIWHTTRHHFELTLDNTVFFRQPFLKRDQEALQRHLKAYTTPILAETYELHVHAADTSMHSIDDID